MILTAALALAAAPATLDLSAPESVVRLMHEEGYQAVLEADPSGDPMIRSKANGATFVVIFYGCTEGKECTDLQFYAAWGTEEKETPADINGFNRNYRFTRAYIDDEHDPVVEMDVMGFDGEVEVARMKRSLDVWSDLMGAYMQHLDSK